MDAPTTPAEPNPDLAHDELLARVLYELLRPAARLAVAFDVPLRDLVELLENAAFREAHRGDGTVRGAAARLGISVRSAERLSRQSRETYVVAELAHHLPRRIEFLLAARPMSEARLVQVLRDVDAQQVQDALAELVSSGRVRADGDRTIVYQPTPGVRSLPRDTWVARVGALGSLGENLGNAVWGRFFANDPAAFARTLSFRIRRERVASLAAWYAENVLKVIAAWNDEDERVEGDETVSMQLSLLWAPYEAMARNRATDGEGR